MSNALPKLHYAERKKLERTLPAANTEALKIWYRDLAASKDRYDHARAAMIERELDRRRLKESNTNAS